MTFNPLAIILKENKLVRPNYIDWKRKLDIVLVVEEYKYVLVEVCPQKPGEGATNEETQAYRKWIKVDEMARCYILASMLNTTMKELMNTTMAKGTPIKDHVLKMIGRLIKLKILEAEIDGETQLQEVESLIRKPTIALVTEKASSSRLKGRKK
ncbi:uncharacterized protein LOC131143449 [Malania oleifera]|uniref:uncharacterized protein LOC131143449 n=1 Tax=Malania oleifera TaxID=397392 RepID=UPI0025AE872F|nr:uncharacterized protein LOC131143449 [Malania oleifera]